MPYPGDQHVFIVTVRVHPFGSEFEPADRIDFMVEERAWNLREAVRQASDRPLADWCQAQLAAEHDYGRALALASDYDRAHEPTPLEERLGL